MSSSGGCNRDELTVIAVIGGECDAVDIIIADTGIYPVTSDFTFIQKIDASVLRSIGFNCADGNGIGFIHLYDIYGSYQDIAAAGATRIGRYTKNSITSIYRFVNTRYGVVIDVCRVLRQYRDINNDVRDLAGGCPAVAVIYGFEERVFCPGRVSLGV